MENWYKNGAGLPLCRPIGSWAIHSYSLRENSLFQGLMGLQSLYSPAVTWQVSSCLGPWNWISLLVRDPRFGKVKLKITIRVNSELMYSIWIAWTLSKWCFSTSVLYHVTLQDVQWWAPWPNEKLAKPQLQQRPRIVDSLCPELWLALSPGKHIYSEGHRVAHMRLVVSRYFQYIYIYIQYIYIIYIYVVIQWYCPEIHGRV